MVQIARALVRCGGVAEFLKREGGVEYNVCLEWHSVVIDESWSCSVNPNCKLGFTEQCDIGFLYPAVVATDRNGVGEVGVLAKGIDGNRIAVVY